MYDVSTRKRALALVTQGRSLNSVSRETGISRAAIRSWQDRIEPRLRMPHPDPGPPSDESAYAYLLGLYLGDGCMSPHPRGGYYLRIACADAWPGLIEECRRAIGRVRPGVGVYVAQKQGCVAVTSYSRSWPVLFPQHGPGKKHERPIVLEPWQQAIVDAHPWNSSAVSSTPTAVGSPTGRPGWSPVSGSATSIPGTSFTNVSDDIRRLYTDTLDKLGIEWTHCTRNGNPFNISVARKASVALMDAHVGPKY